MERDLTVGSVPKQLLSFAAPLFLANLLQSLYSIVDMAVVGRFVGSAGLAAVSSAAMLSFIIQSVCTGVTTGGAVLIAQYKGARDARGQRETTGALFSVSALAALLVTAAGLLAYRPVFTLMNLPAEALPHALRYMRVICLGTVFVFGYNAVCSVLRGLGDSKSPLFFVAVATVVNILLDLLLVGPLGLGTQGAAIATAASQGVSFLTAVVVLRRRGLPLVFSPAYFRTAPKTCCAILRIGFPAAVQMAVLNLSYLLVTGMLNGYGVAVAAAAGVGLKVNAGSRQQREGHDGQRAAARVRDRHRDGQVVDDLEVERHEQPHRVVAAPAAARRTDVGGSLDPQVELRRCAEAALGIPFKIPEAADRRLLFRPVHAAFRVGGRAHRLPGIRIRRQRRDPHAQRQHASQQRRENPVHPFHPRPSRDHCQFKTVIVSFAPADPTYSSVSGS